MVTTDIHRLVPNRARPFVAGAVVLLAVVLPAACSSGPGDSAATPSRPPGLRTSGPRDLLLGTAVDTQALKDEASYRRVLAHEYD